MSKSELKQNLQDAVEYVESLHDAIDSVLTNTGKEAVYRYQGTEVNFDINKAKAVINASNSHDELAEQNKVLRAALKKIKKHNETVTAAPELSANWQIAIMALEQSK